MQTIEDIAAFVILAAYHAFLVFRVRNAPLSTIYGTNNRIRLAWVRSVMREKRDILAVQTLRNWTMAASLLASTAILIGLGIMSVALGKTGLAGDSPALSAFGISTGTLWPVKLLALASCLFIAFFNFTIAIRYYNHASFLVNVPEGEEPIITPVSVSKVINNGTSHYTFGMRAYYMTVPLSLWLLGSHWLLTGAIIIIFVLWRLDFSAR